jgi:L-alanine-DL-glutamate epimerase-like enolase superfamily enzyme
VRRLKIQVLASSFGVMTIPHVWGSGVALAAALHALAATPPAPHTANPIALQNEPVVEFDRTHNCAMNCCTTASSWNRARSWCRRGPDWA